MVKLPRVLAFDPSKISLVKRDGEMMIEKKTSKKEYQQMLQAKKHLQKQSLIQKYSIKIQIAPIIKWDSRKNILTTRYCNGINGEESIKKSSPQKRIVAIDLFKEFFSFIQKFGFLWGDLAPRNTVIDWKNKILWLFDFEKNIVLCQQPISKERFTRYIRNYSLEEFSCFLLAKEQEKFFNNFFTKESGSVHTSDISSKRRRALLSQLFGIKNSYPIEEIHEVENLMIFVATPYKIENKIFYPMEIIDVFSHKGGSNAYAKLVLKLKNLDEKSRYQALKQIS